MSRGAAKPAGRNHLIDGYSGWLGDGSIRCGASAGATDELGFQSVKDPVPVHDRHATIRRQFNFDHQRLTYQVQGRDFRLTDVEADPVQALVG
ncbi:MAG: DUF1501 domain-containing protein [Acidobacteriota bacterium]